MMFGGVMMIGFAIWEAWNDRNEKMRKDAKGIEYVYEGDWDFWESTISFIAGLVALAILQHFGVVYVVWL